MKKNYQLTIAFFLMLITGFVQNALAQTTETFESYTSGKPRAFVSNSQSFTLVTPNCGKNTGGLFGIFIPGQKFLHCGETIETTSTGPSTGGYGVGVGCASATACGGSSNNFIDNSGSASANQAYSIKTTDAALFTIKSIFVYISTDKGLNPTSTGGVTFRGKKTGSTLFTLNPTLTANSNGFTFIDFVAAGFGSVNIDEIEVQGGATINYVALDNFRWGSTAATTTINSIVRASTNPTNQSSVTYTATFGASVTGVNTSNFSLSTNGSIAGASIAGVSGSGTTYTVTVNTGNGSGTIGLNFENATGLSASISTALPFSGEIFTIDRSAPAVTSVNSSTTDGTYKLGANISVQVNFSESVIVTGTPQLTLETGTTDRVVNYASGSGTSTLTFNYTVQVGDIAADLDYTGTAALALNGGTIKDAVGNNAVLVLASPGATNSLGSNKAIRIDGVVPTVSSVGVPANGTYKLGDNLDFTVNFSEVVNITGTPRIALTIGSSSVFANYVSGSGSTAALFRYTVQSGNLDNDGISIGTLSANSGTLRDAALNDATLTLNSVGSTTAVLVDGVVPTVSSVSSSTANGTYKTGGVISIEVNFSENVVVTNTPQLTLETGGTDRVVNYSSGSGTAKLIFTYTVTAGDISSDLDYTSTTALALNGATIKDAAGNNATLTLAAPGAVNSLGNSKVIVIDAVAPTVVSVSSTTANGTYKVGDIINIQVNFSENVIVVDNPFLRLRIGSSSRFIDYTSGSGSTLNFAYTVLANDVSSDLDYSSTAALVAGESIRDAAGNDAVLTLSSPGATGSLGANKNIVIDGVVPTVSITSSVGIYGTTTTTSPIPYTITFSENVTGFVQGDITVGNGNIASFSGSGSVYNITVSPISTGNVSVSVAAGKAVDVADNENTAATQFVINYQGILPVRLISFKAKPEGNAAKLEWSTESESNNKSFGIFRSANEKDFVQIGTVAGNGTTAIRNNYSFYDRQPLRGTNYYKLIQTDYNGTTEELEVRSVDFKFDAEAKLLVIPNPVVAETKVAFPLGTNKIQLVDLLGKVLKTIKVSPLEIEQRIALTGLSRATYSVRSYGSYGVLSTKVIKVD